MNGGSKIDIGKNFPIIKVADDLLLSRNGDITICYKAVFGELNSFNDTKMDKFVEDFRIGFSGLDDNVMLHFQTYAYREIYKRGSHNEEMGKRYLTGSMEKKLYEKKFKVTESFVFITLVNGLSPFEKGIHFSNIFSSGKKTELSEDKVNQFILSANNFVISLKRNFKNFVIDKITDENHELSGNLGKFGISERFLRLAGADDIMIREMRFGDGIVEVGNKVAAVLSVDDISGISDEIDFYTADEKLSTEVSVVPSTFARKIIHSHDLDVIYNVFLFKENKERVRSKIEAEISTKNSFLSHSSENRHNITIAQEYIDNLVSGDLKIHPVGFSANVVIIEDDEKRLKAAVSEMEAVFKANRFIPSYVKDDLAFVIWNSIPGNAGNMTKEHMILSVDYVIFPFLNLEETRSGGNKTLYGFPLFNGKAQRVVVDLFGESASSAIRADITAYNGFIIGPSGSGKSVTLNYLVTSILDVGASVVLIDVGHSYNNLCKLYGGEYIEFGDTRPLSYNPFLIEGRLPTEAERITIATTLLTIWKGDDIVSNLEGSIIEASIQEYYAYLSKANTELNAAGKKLVVKKKFDTYFDFMDIVFRKYFLEKLNTSGEFNLNSFLDNIRAFYVGGIYSSVLNADSDDGVERNRLLIFEMSKIASNIMLNRIVLIYIMASYQKLLKKQDGKRKYLFIEEAWKAVANDKFAVFIKETYKTARKHGGTIMMVTQEPDDLLSSGLISDTIVSQSSIKIFLDMKGYKGKKKDIMERMGMNEEDMALMFSLNRDLPKTLQMRQFFIKWSSLNGVFGIALSEEQYWTYTTEKKEKDALHFIAVDLFKGNIKMGIDWMAEKSRSLLAGGSKSPYSDTVDFVLREFNVIEKLHLNSSLAALDMCVDPNAIMYS